MVGCDENEKSSIICEPGSLPATNAIGIESNCNSDSGIIEDNDNTFNEVTNAYDNTFTEVTNENENLAYNVRAHCNNTFWAFNWIQNEVKSSIGYGNIVQIYLLDENLNEIKMLPSANQGASEISFTSIDFKNELKNNPTYKIKIECKSSSTNKISEKMISIYSLDDIKLWEDSDKNNYNDTMFFISMISDIYTKIYLVEYEYSRNHDNARMKAKQFMEQNFPGSYYDGAIRNWTINKGSMSFTETYEYRNTIQSIYYRYIYDIAADYTKGDITQLNTIIANEYKNIYINHNDCKTKFICAAFFKDSRDVLTENNSFNNDLINWKVEKETLDSNLIRAVINDSQISSVQLELTTDNIEIQKPFYINLSQEYNLASKDKLDDFILRIKNNNLYGGFSDSANLLGGVQSSGYAAYYACFSGDLKEYGCLLYGNGTDRITLPIYVGQQFQITSSDTNYLIKSGASGLGVPSHIVQSNFKLLYFKDLVNHLPNVLGNLSEINKITFGIYLTGLSGDGRYYYNRAFVDADFVSLEKLK